MNISYSWLQRYISSLPSPEETAQLLTAAGLEVEGLETIENDTVFVIGLTPNRVDAASHYGTARDLAAALYRQEQVSLQLPEVNISLSFDVPSPVQVKIGAPEAVTRYSGLCIDGVRVAESPGWLQQALRSIGQKPINTIVDITNFVLHELGQPLHAFDADKIGGATIVVRTCPESTPFTTLDGVERKLNGQELMICDAAGPLCMAGVFGGIHSGVNEGTTRIFLESATFNPVWIRKTSKAHNLKTDSAFRFERGSDPEITLYALQRAAGLIVELAGGTIVPGTYDYYPAPVKWTEIDYPWWKMDRLVGEVIPREEAKSILTRLGIDIKEETSEGLKLQVPPFKVDVKNDADITEEILRIYGYNTITIPSQVRMSPTPAEKPDLWGLRNQLSDHLSAIGFSEAVNNSLSPDSLSRFVPSAEGQPVELLNPLSSELNTLRQRVFFGLCETVAWNRNRQHPDLALYEWGRTYFKAANGYSEKQVLTLAVTGYATPETWHQPRRQSGYFQLKGAFDRVLQLLSLNGQELRIESVEDPALEEALVFLSGDYRLALLGKIGTTLRKHFDIEADVWVAECSWDHLLAVHKEQRSQIREASRFPSVRRDLALLVDNGISFAQISAIARQTEQKLLREINLFDIYQGDKLPAGKKSYAVSYQFLNEEQTLTDAEIEHTMERLIRAYKEQLGAELRG